MGTKPGAEPWERRTPTMVVCSGFSARRQMRQQGACLPSPLQRHRPIQPWKKCQVRIVPLAHRLFSTPNSEGGSQKMGVATCYGLPLFQCPINRCPSDQHPSQCLRFHSPCADHTSCCRKKLPLLVLHGGPGLPSRYLETLELLAGQGRQVIFYDQVCTMT